MNTTAKEPGCPQDAPSVGETFELVHLLVERASLLWGKYIACGIGYTRDRVTFDKRYVTCPECRGRGA